MDEKNRVKLHICGSDFVISSTDSEAYMRAVGERVERTIEGHLERSPNMSLVRAAVFAALEFCDDAAKATENADQLRAQVQTYLEESAAAKSDAAELRRRGIKLERDNAELLQMLEKKTEPHS